MSPVVWDRECIGWCRAANRFVFALKRGEARHQLLRELLQQCLGKLQIPNVLGQGHSTAITQLGWYVLTEGSGHSGLYSLWRSIISTTCVLLLKARMNTQ